MQSDARLYVNATIHTMNGAERAEALLVRDCRIAAVGSRRDVEAGAGRDVLQVDLEGGTVIPGFDDCHCHILPFGLRLTQLDVSRDSARSIQDICRLVRDRAQQMEADEWVLGRGYEQEALTEHRHPTRRDVDEAGGGRPVV